METTVTTSGSSGSRWRSLSTAEKVRLAAFSLVGLAIIGLNIALTPMEVLGALFLSWGGDFGIHQVHDMVISGLLWVAILVPFAIMLYHPSDRVNTILAPVFGAIVVAVFAFLANSPLFTGFLTTSALAIVALVLHPAGRSLLRFDPVDRVDRRLAGLFTVAAIPLLAFAAIEMSKQLGPMNEHVLFVHYGAMAITAALVVLMGALAVFRKRDWRFAAWSSGLLALALGVVSIGFPAIESSLGVIGGGLLVVWAIAFVAGVEYVRRDTAVDEHGGDTVSEAI